MSVSRIVLRIVHTSFSILVLILTVSALYRLGLHAYHYGYRVFAEPAVTSGRGRDRLVHIHNSMSASDIGELLEEKGLIRDKWLFVLQLKLSEYNNKLEAGRYALNTSMTAREMMQVMSGAEPEESAEEEQ